MLKPVVVERQELPAAVVPLRPAVVEDQELELERQREQVVQSAQEAIV